MEEFFSCFFWILFNEDQIFHKVTGYYFGNQYGALINSLAKREKPGINTGFPFT